MIRKPRKAELPKVPELQTLLRRAGLRSTTPRIAVLEHFHATGGQLSHGDLCDALRDRGFDRATLYRILVDLAEAKILSRTDLGDHIWRFELRKSADGREHSEEHPHFVCSDCGSVSCLTDVVVRLQGKAPKSVAKNHVAVQLKGLCDQCA